MEPRRAGDIVGRDGGDEFLVLMADLPRRPPRGARRPPSRRRRASGGRSQQPLAVSAAELDIRASVGISLYPFDAADAQTLLKHADAAMYEAKAAGRDASSIYQPGTSTRRAARARRAPARGDRRARS